MVWRLQRILLQVTSTHSESSWEDRWCLSPLPPGHLQHPSHPQRPLHCRWSHPPDTQLLQSAAIREETAESPGQQTEGQLHPSACQEAELPPDLAPPPLFYPTQHWTLTLRPPPPSSPHPQDLPPPLHLQTVTRTSHFVQHWTYHYLIQHWLQTTSSDSLIKDCSLSSYQFNILISSFCTTLIISAVLFI